MPSTLAYWDIRGLAHPIRMLLTYVGEDFEDKKYSCGPAPDYSLESWMSEKFKLGLDFPNLPYYDDGRIKISQSNAILRTIARKHDLCGHTDVEKAHVDMMADQVMDLRNGFVELCYDPNYADMVEGYRKALPGKLKMFDDFIEDKKFFVGDEVTFPDFHMFEMLDQHKQFEPTCLDNFPKLRAFHERFAALPAIKVFLESDEFKMPLNMKMAGFGNKL